MDKHLVLFPIPNPFDHRIRRIMDSIATITNIPPLYHKSEPHVTLHRPIIGIDEPTIKRLVASVALQTRRTRITVNSIFAFKKRYVVLPVQTTHGVASLWVGINNLLARLPGYEHGPYDHDNTLHITVATEMASIFDQTWPLIQKVRVEPMTIPFEEIALYRKPAGGGTWIEVAAFPLQA